MNNPYSSPTSLASPNGLTEQQRLALTNTIESADKTACQSLQAFRTKLSQLDPRRSVTLVAVSKTVAAEQVAAMALAGQHHFGENYPDEGVKKIARVNELMQMAWRERANLGTSLNPAQDRPLRPIWHLIGPLQSNKTRMVAEHFDWVQSLDRLKIAQRLSDQRQTNLGPLNICIQVNISGETSKSGISLSELPEFAAQVATLPNLRLRGLMAIPAPLQAGVNENQVQNAFADLKRAFDELQQQGYALDTLSMGMSADYPLAIATGSTMIRVGTALFGQRQTTSC